MELRKDYILNRWAYISEVREKRPSNFKFVQNSIEVPHPKSCPFCIGAENQTPDEKGRVVESGRRKWLIRWVANKYSALELHEYGKILSENTFFKAYSPYGLQEVIIETPDKKQMADFSHDHLVLILKVYNNRIEELSKIEGINYVMVFKNQGREAGASIIHSHSQVVAVGKVPALIAEEVKEFNTYQECPYCNVIEAERMGPRKVFENEDFVAFTPYAPRFNYEIRVYPKKHMRKLSELQNEQYFNLADILKKILHKLQELNASYCFYIQYAPKDQDFHWHLEILPRLSNLAGFELSGGDGLIGVSPEDAANFYRN